MKCKYKESCGYEFCLDDCCPEFEAAVETNADRIRAMSDEELEWAIDPAIVPPGMSKREWLKQPAEEK